MAIEADPAGYETYISRNWTVPQGADTVNALRPYTIDAAGDKVFVDLTAAGWSAQAQIRDEVGGEVWETFSSSDDTGARIDLDAEGWVSVVLPAAVTEAWDSTVRQKGVYDVELTDPSGHKVRLAKGRVRVSPDVTREVTP